MAAIRGRGAGGRIDAEKIPKLAQFLKWDNMAMVQAGQGLKAFSFSWPSAMNCADFALFVGIDIMAGCRGCRGCRGCACLLMMLAESFSVIESSCARADGGAGVDVQVNLWPGAHAHVLAVQLMGAAMWPRRPTWETMAKNSTVGKWR